jgi:AcrR family transcriptional regulator
MPARQRRKAETRTALIEAAFELCATRGLDGPTIDEIAAHAGFTKGAFYAHFASKQDLFMAMTDERFTAVTDALAKAVAGNDPVDEAAAAALRFIRTVNEAPGGARLFFQFVAFAGRHEEFKRRFDERYGILHQHIVEILAIWAPDFEPPVLPLDQVASLVSSMANGFLLEQQIDPDLPDELHGTMLAIFFRGLQAVSAGWEPESKGA